MHHQTIRVSELTAWGIQHVQIDGVLGVESIRRRRGPEADQYRLTARQIKSTKPEFIRRLASAIDSLPYPLQDTAIDCGLETAPGHPSQDLPTAGHATLVVEELLELGIHGQDLRSQPGEAIAPEP